MTARLDLKEIERKAFRSTYQDGLRDIYLGLVVACMSIFVYRPSSGYSLMNIFLTLAALGLAHGLFWAGKKFITLPRMGQVHFGPARKQKKTTLAVILGVVVLIQVAILGLTIFAWANPQVGAQVKSFFQASDVMDLIVAAVGSLFVGPSMIVVSYFTEFRRGYYISALMSLAVFLMLYLNQPLYPILISGLILLPGLVIFVRFLRKYPLPREDAAHE
jgi:Ca2+/Na+ antiporter